ncbi:hypothetical protein P4388_33900, partial [Bacillus thuringiensis]|nr:hypothetical protein [Bacillus thuringiensis]
MGESRESVDGSRYAEGRRPAASAKKLAANRRARPHLVAGPKKGVCHNQLAIGMPGAVSLAESARLATGPDSRGKESNRAGRGRSRGNQTGREKEYRLYRRAEKAAGGNAGAGKKGSGESRRSGRTSKCIARCGKTIGEGQRCRAAERKSAASTPAQLG